LATTIQPVPIATIINQNLLRSSLAFIEVYIDQQIIKALIDSGSAINVISNKLASHILYELLPEPPHTLISCTGSTTTTLHWGKTHFILPNGQRILLLFAVVDILPWQFILGLPFLISSKLIAHFANSYLINEYGPIPLLTELQQQPLPPKITTNAMETLPSTSEPGPIPAPPNAQSQLKDVCQTIEYPEAVSPICDLLSEFQDVWFSQKPSKCRILTHTIELMTNRPLVVRPRRYSPEQIQVITAEINQMEQNGIIRPSCSSYATEIVLVRKKDGPWRICIDYRLLNKFTKVDKYPLPRIADLLRSLKGSSVFIALDLRAGYWNICMDPVSAAFTAFRTPNGLYEFTVMPFGLANAPATFQRVMDFAFQDLYERGVAVYLDDILVHGRTVDEVITLLGIILKRLRYFGLRLHLQKSKFLQRQLLYLGHSISEGQIRPNATKVAVLNRIRPPTSPQEVRKLMGMLSYFRIYIPSFSMFSYNFTELLKKGSVYKWTPNHQFALEFCLFQLAQAVLTLPLDNDDFILETDASDFAAGAVLSVCRNDKICPVEFASVTLKGAEIRWPTREKEGFAIFWALNHFDHYLRGRQFKVYTDHESLMYMTKAKSGKLARWSCRLAEYNFTLYHKSGALMDHVDFFSRFIMEVPEPIEDRMVPEIPAIACATIATTVEPHNPLLKQIIPCQFPSYEDILAAQQAYTPAPTGRPFSRHQGAYFYNHGLWIPPPLRLQIIAACHLVPPYRHCGHKKTQKSILRTCNWPGLHQDVANYIRSCLVCQRLRPRIEHLQGQFLHQPPAAILFEQIHIDHWGPCLWVENQPYILTMIDSLARWCECVVVKDITAETTVRAFVEQWICRYGVPQTVVSDKGPAFWSEVFARCSSLLGFSHIRTTARHPEGNAMIETFHRTLKKNIASIHLNNNQIPFSTAVQLASYSYRSTIHLALGDSPAFLTFGSDLRPPIENDWRFLRHASDRQRAKVLSEIRLQQYERAHAQFVFLSQLDQPGRTHDVFEVGDLVLVALPKEEIARNTRREKNFKIAPKFGMPARVIRVSSNRKTAMVRHLGSGRTQEVHIQQARFLSLPACSILQRQWLDVASREAEAVIDHPQKRQQYLSTFWKELTQPQEEGLAPPTRRKRARHEQQFCGGE
jgi:transposase InsO family protein